MSFFGFGKVARVLVLGMASLLSASVMAGLSATAPKPESLPTGHALEYSQKITLAFSAPEQAGLQSLAVEQIAVAQLETGLAAHTWTVTASGTQVSNARGKRKAFIAALTSREVRPQAVADTARGAVWFYGEDLYRYRAANGELVRFRLAQSDLGAVRAVVTNASGVWLVAANGVAMLDDAHGKLSAIRHPLLNGQRLVRAVELNGEVWLAQEPSRLVRMVRTSSGEIQISASQQLPLGVMAEMLVVKDRLWLLASYKNGDSYQLAFAEPRDSILNVVAGNVYSLRAQQGKLYATTHRDLYTIDPASLMVATARIDAARSLAQLTQSGQVLFVGSSYGVKDNCEVVEHRRTDLSKGWMNPGLELYAPVRLSAMSEAR